LVNSAIAGLKEGKKLSGEARLPDSDLGFYNFCQKSLQLGKSKTVMQMAELDKRRQFSVGAYNRPAMFNARREGLLSSH
jgi:hypothetical protein